MKTTIFTIMLFLTATTVAQKHQGMNQEAMQKMMIQVKKMQTCIAKIDPKDMQALKKRLKGYNTEINSLCKSGKRTAAQAKAIATAKVLLKDPTMLAMSNCTKPMSKMMKGMGTQLPTLETYTRRVKDNKHHVCNER